MLLLATDEAFIELTTKVPELKSLLNCQFTYISFQSKGKPVSPKFHIINVPSMLIALNKQFPASRKNWFSLKFHKMAHNKFLHSVQEALKIIENIPIDSHLSLEFAHEPYNPNIYQTMQLLPLIEGVFEESKISSFHIDVFKQYCKFNRLTKARDGYQGIFEVFADVKLQYLRGTKHLRFDIAELVCDLSIPDNKTNGQKVEPMRLLAWFEKSGQSDFKHKCLNASNGLIRSVNMVCSNDLLLEEARDEPVTITGEQLKELNKKMLEISISLQKFEETPRSSDIVKALEKSFQVIRYRPAWSIEYVIRNLIFLKDLCNCEERPKEIERIWMQVMTLS